MRDAARALGLVGLLSIAASVPAQADVVLSDPDTNDGGYSMAQLQNIAAPGDTYGSVGLSRCLSSTRRCQATPTRA